MSAVAATAVAWFTAGPGVVKTPALTPEQRLRAMVLWPKDACKTTSFDRTSLRPAPAGYRAALTCATSPGRDQIAFYQLFGSAAPLDRAFRRLASTANYTGDPGAELVACPGADDAGVAGWNADATTRGERVCLQRARADGVIEHWLVWTQPGLRLVAELVDVRSLKRAHDEWGKALAHSA